MKGTPIDGVKLELDALRSNQVKESEILLSEMKACRPSSALSAERRSGHWQLIPYETYAFEGTLISAGFMTDPPEVRLPCPHQGCYAIHIGLWLTGQTAGGWGRTTMASDAVGSLKIRLEGDPCFVAFRREVPERDTLEDVFWKIADLEGEDIVISQQLSGFRGQSSLAYVRLVPLPESQTEAWREGRTDTSTRTLVATNDGFGAFFRNEITTREGIWEQIEPYRDTDFGMLWWEVVTGMFGAWREEGKTYGEEVEDYPRPGDLHMATSYRTMKEQGINPLKTAMDFAQDIGLSFYVSQRSEMFQAGPPFEEVYSTQFYHDHPEWRLQDIDGTEVTGMSYAHPGVRSYLIGLLEQATSLGADGACVIYPRSAPFVLYEEPVLADFEEEHGVDARTVDEEDDRLIDLRAAYMTTFMTELRKAMDRVGAKLGKRLDVSAVVFATESENRLAGLYLDEWISTGLVDHLSPYPYSRAKTEMDIETTFFRQLTVATSCKLYPNVMPRHMSAASYREKAKFYYDEGADGLLFWDTYQRHDGSSGWQTIRRLGHREEIPAAIDQSEPENEPRLIPLTRLAGHHMRRYSPYRGA